MRPRCGSALGKPTRRRHGATLHAHVGRLARDPTCGLLRRVDRHGSMRPMPRACARAAVPACRTRRIGGLRASLGQWVDRTTAHPNCRMAPCGLCAALGRPRESVPPATTCRSASATSPAEEPQDAGMPVVERPPVRERGSRFRRPPARRRTTPARKGSHRRASRLLATRGYWRWRVARVLLPNYASLAPRRLQLCSYCGPAVGFVGRCGDRPRCSGVTGAHASQGTNARFSGRPWFQRG